MSRSSQSSTVQDNCNIAAGQIWAQSGLRRLHEGGSEPKCDNNELPNSVHRPTRTPTAPINIAGESMREVEVRRQCFRSFSIVAPGVLYTSQLETANKMTANTTVTRVHSGSVHRLTTQICRR